RLPRVPRALFAVAGRQAQEARVSLKSSPAASRESVSMTAYSDEPKSAAELLARYRDVKRRLYPVPSRSPTCDFTAVGAENILAFALAVAAVAAERARESRRRADEVPRRLGLESPGSRTRAALRAVSQ